MPFLPHPLSDAADRVGDSVALPLHRHVPEGARAVRLEEQPSLRRPVQTARDISWPPETTLRSFRVAGVEREAHRTRFCVTH